MCFGDQRAHSGSMAVSGGSSKQPVLQDRILVVCHIVGQQDIKIEKANI